MAGRYLELTLYFAHCNSRGIVEGRFDSEYDGSEYIKRKRIFAIEVIGKELVRAIEGNLPWNNIVYGFSNFVSDEREAITLIEFLERGIKGSTGFIEPYDCMHGRLRFFRKIKFEGVGLEDMAIVIRGVKESELHLTSEGAIRHIDNKKVLHQYTKFK